jgi:hypothetical protein
LQVKNARKLAEQDCAKGENYLTLSRYEIQQNEAQGTIKKQIKDSHRALVANRKDLKKK